MKLESSVLIENGFPIRKVVYKSTDDGTGSSRSNMNDWRNCPGVCGAGNSPILVVSAFYKLIIRKRAILYRHDPEIVLTLSMVG